MTKKILEFLFACVANIANFARLTLLISVTDGRVFGLFKRVRLHLFICVALLTGTVTAAVVYGATLFPI